MYIVCVHLVCKIASPFVQKEIIAFIMIGRNCTLCQISPTSKRYKEKRKEKRKKKKKERRRAE